MDCIDVSLQVGGGDESVITLGAHVRPLTAVGHLVLGQVAQLFESPSTHFAGVVVEFTFVWIFPSVNSLVSHQVALLVKILLAHLTLVFLCRLLISDRLYFSLLDQFFYIFWNN